MKGVKFLTPPETIKGLFVEASQEPVNLKKAEHDPNEIYIPVNMENKKKKQITKQQPKPEQE